MKDLISNYKWKLWQFWYKLRCKLFRSYDVSIAKLVRITPKDTFWWGSGSEICGFSKSTGIHFVIEDGGCCDIDGLWLVSIFKITNPEQHFKDIFEGSSIGPSTGYFGKYPSCENSKCIYQEWVDFRTWKSAWNFSDEIKKIIESGKSRINVWDEDDEAYVYNRCAFCKYYRAGDRCSHKDNKITIDHDCIEICKRNNMHKFI